MKQTFKQEFSKHCNIILLIFLAVALISFSYISSIVVHEQVHVNEANRYNLNITSVCYFGKAPNGITYNYGWLERIEYQTNYHVMNEDKAYMYQAIALILNLIISSIILIKFTLLIYGEKK